MTESVKGFHIRSCIGEASVAKRQRGVEEQHPATSPGLEMPPAGQARRRRSSILKMFFDVCGRVPPETAKAGPFADRPWVRIRPTMTTRTSGGVRRRAAQSGGGGLTRPSLSTARRKRPVSPDTGRKLGPSFQPIHVRRENPIDHALGPPLGEVSSDYVRLEPPQRTPVWNRPGCSLSSAQENDEGQPRPSFSRRTRSRTKACRPRRDLRPRGEADRGRRRFPARLHRTLERPAPFGLAQHPARVEPARSAGAGRLRAHPLGSRLEVVSLIDPQMHLVLSGDPRAVQLGLAHQLAGGALQRLGDRQERA